MDELRIGIVGCGGVAQHHMAYFPEIPRLRFAAACDPVPESLHRVVEKHGVTGYDDAERMLDDGVVDAVLIATPHYHHPAYAQAALERGIHVLCEKPLAVTAGAADAALAAWRARPELRFGCMFQMRTAPNWRYAKRLVEGGSLGALQRVSWTITSWFRPQAYYDQGGWRGTWSGEGGGVLMNQCPHQLDLLAWLTGLPERVDARLGLGKYHDIEVEDEVTAFFAYPNGASGVFVTSTGEAPGRDQLEIVGDRATLRQSDGRLELVENEVPTASFLRTSEAPFSKPDATRSVIEPPSGGGHRAVTENFVRAVLDGEELVAPADEGLASVELINGMLLSGMRGRPVDLPTDRSAYDALLAELIHSSSRKSES